jgi:hypothetical protein
MLHLLQKTRELSIDEDGFDDWDNDDNDDFGRL